MTHVFRLYAAVLFMVTAASSLLPAQSFTRMDETTTNTAYFFYARPGDPTIQVWVWGVQAPGLYEIRSDVNVGQVLTMAGGPPLQTREQRMRVNSILKVYRGGVGERALIYDARLEDVLARADYPPLQDGDVLVLETLTRRLLSWRDVVQVAAAASTLVLLVDRIRMW